MKHIKILPQLLVDKIAAGEVIERPASVVKELIENAIDAGSSEIKIEIEDGGKKLIRVTDNGEGILAEDMSLVFVRHATSKITEETDLYRIKTLGFRGEALASIAAVSKCRLVSRTASEGTAWCVTCQSGEIEKPYPCAGEKGTTIEVSHLFFNTPARLKFLKSSAVELFHITDIVTRLALAYPEIRFDLVQLTSDKRENILNLPAVPTILERLTHLFGQDFTAGLIKSEFYISNESSVLAYLSPPTQTKSTPRYQYFYLNRRFIRDRFLSRSVMQAYSNFIPSHRFPVIFWFMKLPPEEFDVNVHPTKIEVRFRNTWAIHDVVIKTIHQALTNHSTEIGINPAILVAEKPTSFRDKLPSKCFQPDERERILQAMVDFFATHSHSAPSISSFSNSQVSVSLPKEDNLISSQVAKQTQDKTLALEKTNRTLSHLPSKQEQIFTSELPIDSWQSQKQLGRSFFQFHNTYIIQEVTDGLLIIDQHALHERILYNQLKRAYSTRGINRQQLLLPIIIELEAGKMEILVNASSYLNQLGFEIEEFGRNTIRLLTIPSEVNSPNLAELIKDIIDNLTEFEIIAPGGKEPRSIEQLSSERIIENLLNLIACKLAIKAGERLTDREIASLLAQCKETDYHLTCPHGRPVVFKLTLTELAKYFHR